MDRLPTDRSPERGQTSPIGIVLILGITLSAAILIVVVGVAGIQNVQTDSQIRQAEQALSQFDASAAQVALGESRSQSVRLGQSGGEYSIDEDAGRVKLVHRNWDGNGTNETILEENIGAIIYENGGTTIAYQGGGVWRSDDGRSTMISSPEFHYQRATLTFPIIRVVGSGSAGGRHATGRVQQRSTSLVFPSDDTYDGSTDRYDNPIDEGNMTVIVDSEYCEGWRTYLEGRTDGDVSDCEDGVVEARLVTLGGQGPFDIIGGNELPIRGQEGLKTFEVTLRPQDSESSDFNNLGWSMSAREGEQELELSIQGSGGTEVGDPVTVTIYYSEDGGDTYHGWMNDEDYTVESEGNSVKVTIDFLADDTNGNWSEVKGSDLEEFNPGTQAAGPPSDFDESEPMDNVTQYYIDQMGDFNFDTNEQNAANLADDSQGVMEYEGGGEVVTFLHVTDNEVEVRLTA